MDGHTRHTILTAVVGSKLHGNARPDSDTDLFSIHVDPTFDLVGLNRPPQPTFHVNDGNDHVSWEVGFFISKALGGELNSLEVLWADEYPVEGRWADWLLDIRTEFLSQRIANRWLGFAKSDLARVREGKDERRTKKAAFQICRVADRLGRVWRTGEMSQLTTEEAYWIQEWVDDFWNKDEFVERLELAIDLAAETVNTEPTPLPPEPRTDDIELLLIDIRAQMMTPVEVVR